MNREGSGMGGLRLGIRRDQVWKDSQGTSEYQGWEDPHWDARRPGVGGSKT